MTWKIDKIKVHLGARLNEPVPVQNVESICYKDQLQCTKPLGPLNYIILEFFTIPVGQNGSRQDNIVWKKIISPSLLTMASMRWIKEKATQTPGRKAEKTCEKLMILIEKSKILEKKLYYVKAEKTCEKLMILREERDNGKVALLCWELLSYKPLATIFSLVQGKVEMHGKLFLRISAVSCK